MEIHLVDDLVDYWNERDLRCFEAKSSHVKLLVDKFSFGFMGFCSSSFMGHIYVGSPYVV